MRHDRRAGAEHHRRFARHHGDRGGAVAFVRDVHGFYLREQVHEFAGEMRRAEIAARCVRQFVRIGPGERQQFLEGFRGQRRMHGEHVIRERDETDRAEIPDRVVRQLGRGRGQNGERRDVAQHHRVAIGRGFGREFGADESAGAAARVDHDLLAHLIGQRLRDDARRRVGAAAGRIRRNQLDRLRRISLAPGAGAVSRARSS